MKLFKSIFKKSSQKENLNFVITYLNNTINNLFIMFILI